jgi:endogenous inhibitor of DNA gyrase (YacG/DUF329 family)
MLIRCPHCGADVETTATWSPSAKVPCPRCGKKVPLQAAAPRVGEGTIPLEGERTAIASKGLGLALPPGKRVSLLQLSGPGKGDLIPVTKPRLVLGREGGTADAQLNDPEISRAHAAFECYGPRMLVRDLGSRNGTFVKEQQIETAPLEDHAEFRIGSTILMVLLTDAE